MSKHIVRPKTNPDTTTINIILQGDAKKQYEDLKDHYGIKSNADLFRLIMHQEHNRLKKAGEM
ncbi:MAG: hypothetical protein FWD52_04745 [Candidatus Bathyarchaeota archaeon]|nr:hypothetical protein [Candidatus Termiticorpusculum sp.]